MEILDTKAIHKPVLIGEIMSYIKDEYTTIMDCTVGEGGHSYAIKKKFGDRVFLICVDLDSEILGRAMEILDFFGKGRMHFANNNFKNLGEIFEDIDIKSVDCMIVDLGISTYHYFQSGRGFSFNDECLLDLRLDKSKGIPLCDLLPSLGCEEIERIIIEYSDEKHAKRIAKSIFYNRLNIRKSSELAKVVLDSVPNQPHSRIHPATKTFMAFRIYINEELTNLCQFLDIFPAYLNSGGRIMIISFHSVEDRIVKNYFRKYSYMEKANKYRSSKKIKPTGINITKKPIKPSREEVYENQRARSAKLRVFERI